MSTADDPPGASLTSGPTDWQVIQRHAHGLGRMDLAAPAVVHGGAGLAPASVPIDIERFIPMLGFYQAPVTAA